MHGDHNDIDAGRKVSIGLQSLRKTGRLPKIKIFKYEDFLFRHFPSALLIHLTIDCTAATIFHQLTHLSLPIGQLQYTLLLPTYVSSDDSLIVLISISDVYLL